MIEIQTAIQTLTERLAEDVQIDTEALNAEKDTLTEQKMEFTKLDRILNTRLETNRKVKENISRQADAIAELDDHFGWVNTLSRTANGNVNGKGKIMLETYIQTTYFDRILHKANIRLAKMSGGQYDLKRKDKLGKGDGKSGLDLNILDHVNGTERSVNTLSGGEAFLASLALALGLSDEVQMSTGIRLDTLFVDEGFGSLDTESLSKAYNTLASLTEGNRLVGIISHVTELKERIDRQIVVTKQKTGESAAKICI